MKILISNADGFQAPAIVALPAALKAIAEKTGGRYFRASDVASLTQIYGLIDKVEPMAKDQQSWRPVDELYLWPLGVALLLSAAIALSAPGALPGIRFARTRPA